MIYSMNDLELLEKYQKGDESAFEQLIKRHFKSVYSMAYKYVWSAQEAEDVTQEVFVKAWKNIKKFDKTKNFKTWILTITKNTAIDSLKKKKMSVFSDFQNADGGNHIFDSLRDLSPIPSELSEKKDDSKFIAAAVKSLPEKYHKIFHHRYSNGFAFREISDLTNEPINTIKSRHRRGLQMLKKLFSHQN